MANIRLYGGRHNPGRKTCNKRHRKRAAGEMQPLKLYSIVDCIRKAGLR